MPVVINRDNEASQSQFFSKSDAMMRRSCFRSLLESFWAPSRRNPIIVRRSLTSLGSMTSENDTASQILYEPLEGVERLEYYRAGGYHPVKIGDEFQGRYRVVHKLGYGSYSTTWHGV